MWIFLIIKKTYLNQIIPGWEIPQLQDCYLKMKKKFSYHFPQYEIIKNKLSEFSIFLNSGGVINNIFHISVNKFFFNLLNFVDKILIFLLPNVFALNRRIVLKKK